MLSHHSPLPKDMCQASFYPYAPRIVSVYTELTLGHSRYPVTNVPPQPNSPSAIVPSRTRYSGLITVHRPSIGSRQASRVPHSAHTLDARTHWLATGHLAFPAGPVPSGAISSVRRACQARRCRPARPVPWRTEGPSLHWGAHCLGVLSPGWSLWSLVSRNRPTVIPCTAVRPHRGTPGCCPNTR